MGREKDPNELAAIDSLDELELDLDILETTEEEVEEEDFEELAVLTRNQIREEERRQIEEFLKTTIMVRCERYNANITAMACRNKKESPPPRLRNTLSEEENLQQHPCYGCVGPIVINWPIEKPPIPLYEIEEKPIISHPNLEDDFSLAREKQIESYKKEEEKNYEEREKLPSTADSSPQSEIKKPEASDKRQAVEGEIPEAKEKEVEPKIEEPTEKKRGRKSKTSRETTETEKPKKRRRKKDKSPPTACAECGRPYTEENAKYWRGDICNPCYAKKLRARKKAEKSESKRTKREKKKKTPEEHPPCAECGRPYEPKYWRGDICNPCYAKKLRAKKKAQQQQKETKNQEKK